MLSAHFHEVARLVPHPMLLLTGDGAVVAANAAAHERLAPPGERLEGRLLADLTADSPAQIAEYLRLCPGDGEPLLGAVSLSRPNGILIELRCWGSRVRDDGEGTRIMLRFQPHGAPSVDLVLLNRKRDELRAEHRARLTAERLAARLGQLQALTAAFSEARTPSEVATVVVSQGCAAIGAPRGTVAVLDEEGAMLRVLCAVGYAEECVGPMPRVPMSEQVPLTDVARSGTTIFLETKADALARYPSLARLFVGDAPERALVSLPLTVRDRTFGTLSFTFDEARRFDERDRAFLLAFAQTCAQALDRARAYETEARARVDAEAANRAKDEFLSTLSHELRTPLTSILGWVNILRTTAAEPAVTARALATIERNARTQAQLIEDILDVSRIVAGKLALELRPIDPAAIVRMAVDMIRPAAEHKRVRIDATIDDAIGTLEADPDRLQQIASNLLSNAVKFTPKGGAIEVRLDRHEERVRLRVIDSGKGIDAQFLPHVFERFRQADTSHTRAHGGLGLGLAIVEHLVALHEGTITAESAGAGRGATFTVSLPAPPPSAASFPGWVADPLTPAPLRLDGVQVVVVDDEPDALELLATILQAQGAIVRTAASAQEALSAVGRERPHVLVSDISMPHEDGYALLQKVRALSGDRESGVAALALTAHAGPDAARRAELAGFRRHLAKPVSPSRLVDEVARLAGRVPSDRERT